MDRIDRLKKREARLVYKGYKAVDEGRERKADRLLARAAKVENRIIKLSEKKKDKHKKGGFPIKNLTTKIKDNGKVTSMAKKRR